MITIFFSRSSILYARSSVFRVYIHVSKTQRPLRQRHPQDRVEQVERTERHEQGKRYRQRPAALFHDSNEKDQHEQHRDTVAEALHPQNRKDAGRQNRQSMAPLGPTQ